MDSQRASIGPAMSTRRKRATCIAITKDTSALVEAAMIATESAPPGLVARKAVRGSISAKVIKSMAKQALMAINARIAPSTWGNTCHACCNTCRVNREPIPQPNTAKLKARHQLGKTMGKMAENLIARPIARDSNKGPLGRRRATPIMLVVKMTESVMAKPDHEGTPSQSTDSATEPSTWKMAATTVAAIAQHATRKYCMKATSRISAP